MELPKVVQGRLCSYLKLCLADDIGDCCTVIQVKVGDEHDIHFLHVNGIKEGQASEP